MKPSKLRHRIAWEAAWLIYTRQELELHRARLQAARRFCRGLVADNDLPTGVEIREQVQAFADDRHGEWLEKRSAEALAERDLARERAEAAPPVERGAAPERFLLYQMLLQPLERVRLPLATHPAGDALYHSLQVFELAREELPYDEEFLLAALLHEVGLAIDQVDPVAAAIETLGDGITERTAWLIENLAAAHLLIDGAIGARARRRLQEAEDYEELMLLARCDRAGRGKGVRVCDAQEACDYVRELAAEWEGEGE